MLDKVNQLGKAKFNASAVEMKMNLTAEATDNMIFAIDLATDEMIYIDKSFDNTQYGGNSFGSQNEIKAMLFKGTSVNRVSLYDLFTLHVSEEDLVETIEEADTVFAVEAPENTEQTVISPNDLEIIMGEFLQ